MPFKKTLLAMMMFGAAAAQADYQVQIDASYKSTTEEIEYDDSRYDIDVDEDEFAAEASLYFSPVSTKIGPLDEAEFLSKASRATVGYASIDTDYDSNFYGKRSVDSNGMLISGRFVLPSPSLILEATYVDGERDEEDFDVLGFGFGGYITDRITLIAEYSTREYDDRSGDDSIDTITLTYRQLIQLGGEMNLAIEPHLSRIDYFGEDAAEVGVDVAFYLNRSLGFKAGVTGTAIDDEGGDYTRAESYIGVDYFINENVKVGGKLLAISSEYDADDYYYNDDEESEGGGIEINAAVRF